MADEPTPVATPTPAAPATPATPAPTPEASEETPSIAGDAPSDSIAGEQVTKPIEYKDFTVPEGFELDPKALGPVKDVFNDLRINQDGAQKLIDLFASNAQALVREVEESARAEWTATRVEWTKTIESDPEIGGAMLPQTRSNISKSIDRFGTPEVRAQLKLTGADNAPAIVKYLAKMAAVLTEGKFVQGDVPKPAPRTAAQALYPTGPNSGLQGRPETT